MHTDIFYGVASVAFPFESVQSAYFFAATHFHAVEFK